IDEPAVYNTALSASRVSAHYTAGSGAAPPLNAPSGLTATAASTSQINLAWTDNSSNESNFVIQRDTNSGFTAPTNITAGANTTSYQDTGLSASTTYYYRVKATNSSTSSNYTNTASATTQSPPPPPPTGYAAAVTADNPVSYWRLGETSGSSALDQQSKNPGTYLNSPTLGAPSLLGSDTTNKAVTFDGTNDQVRIANSTSLQLSSPITLEAWIKPTSLPAAGSFASVVTKAETYSIQFNGPRLEFTIMQFGVRKRLQAASGAIVAGQTYHVVGTYDGTTQRLYINGAQVASAALTGGATSSTNPVVIGSWDGSQEFFQGTIDEVAVYGTSLSAARALAHYTAGK
ncbi:MAG: LamG-like jellyroll fold domain-containing protein, partial [Thermoleophilaceae bacterium]